MCTCQSAQYGHTVDTFLTVTNYLLMQTYWRQRRGNRNVTVISERVVSYKIALRWLIQKSRGSTHYHLTCNLLHSKEQAVLDVKTWKLSHHKVGLPSSELFECQKTVKHYLLSITEDSTQGQLKHYRIRLIEVTLVSRRIGGLGLMLIKIWLFLSTLGYVISLFSFHIHAQVEWITGAYHASAIKIIEM